MWETNTPSEKVNGLWMPARWNKGPTHLTMPGDELPGEPAILRLAERGFRLFHVVPGAKLPLFAGWLKEATCDLKALEAWGR